MKSTNFITTVGIFLIVGYCRKGIRCVSSLQTHKFRKGENVSFIFRHNLSNHDSRYVCEAYSLNANQPFYANGQMNPDILYESQRGRFDVRIKTVGNQVSIHVSICEIDDMDSGVYIVTVRETTDDGVDKDSIYDVYIKIMEPPSKANCSTNLYRLYRDIDVMRVMCTCTVGSEGNERIICYQNSAEAIPVHSRNARIGDQIIRASFWANARFPVNCCTVDVDARSDPQTCTDFHHPALVASDDSETSECSSEYESHEFYRWRIFIQSLLTNHCSVNSSRSDAEQDCARFWLVLSVKLNILFMGNSVFLVINGLPQYQGWNILGI